MTNHPDTIILHTAAASVASAEDVDRWHRARGFRRAPFRAGHLRHIGYHAYIRKTGDLIPCRDENEMGAHCVDGGMNSRSIGICLEGHGDREPWTVSQFDTLVTLLADIRGRHPRIAVRGTSALIGHREAGAPKTCPGLMIDMDGVRDWFAAFVVARGVRPVEALPLLPMDERPDRP